MIIINATDFGWSQIDDDFVMYSISDNTYYVLNETAKEIWEYIYNSSDGCEKKDIIEYLLDIYDCDNIDKLKIDINDLIDTFLAMKVIEII